MIGPSRLIKNKYLRWYQSIIHNAQNRVLQGYSEKHHIYPRSFGGTNAKHNLVRLSAREHFLCHWLLTKCTSGDCKRRMLHALSMMNKSKNIRGTVVKGSWRYARSKQAASDARRGTRLTAEQKKKLSEIGKMRIGVKNPFYGKKHTEDFKRSRSLATSGPKHVFYGKKRPIQAVKMSQKMKGRTKTEQHKRSLSNSWQASRQRILCRTCGVETTKAMHTRWHGSNCKRITGEA